MDRPALGPGERGRRVILTHQLSRHRRGVALVQALQDLSESAVQPGPVDHPANKEPNPWVTALELAMNDAILK